MVSDTSSEISHDRDGKDNNNNEDDLCHRCHPYSVRHRHRHRCDHRVRFKVNEDGDIHETHVSAPHLLKPSDLFKCWWTKDDLLAARQSVEDGIDRQTNGKASRSFFQKTMVRVFRTCSKDMTMSVKLRADLESLLLADGEHWKDNPIRGMERVLVPLLRLDRHHRRRGLLKSVKLIQQRCQDDCVAYDLSSRLIRAASRKHSGTSARFASVMATTDAVVARAVMMSIPDKKPRDDAEEGEEEEGGGQEDGRRTRTEQSDDKMAHTRLDNKPLIVKTKKKKKTTTQKKSKTTKKANTTAIDVNTNSNTNANAKTSPLMGCVPTTTRRS